MTLRVILGFEVEFSHHPSSNLGNFMSTPLSIETAQKRNLKQTVKELAGQVAAVLASRRALELSESPVSQPSGLQDKLIMSYLKRRAFTNKQESFFEKLHLDFWQGEGGEVYSKNCDHRFEDLFLAKQQPDFDKLRFILQSCQISRIVEFGCNSGLLLQYMTSELAGIRSSTGIEINATQVRQNQESTKFDSRIEFSNADGGDWLLANGKVNSLFVTNGGVLEYFRRERLNQMLTHISSILPPSVFLCSRARRQRP